MLKEIYNKQQEHYYLDERGRFQGECKTWWTNGQLAVHCFYLNNNYHGEYKSWKITGELEAHCFYDNDKRITFKTLPYPVTPEDRFYFTLKHNLPLLPEIQC